MRLGHVVLGFRMAMLLEEKGAAPKSDAKIT
jgi:hypothetical protein